MGLVNAANGNISAKYEYGPFGEVFCAVGDMAKVNPFQFSTKYTDNETDFVYYGYRYYSPALGRWLSRDPIEEQGGLNLYGFVSNDPVNKWDRLGLQTPPSYYIVFPPEPPPFDEWIIDYGHLYPSIYFPDSIKTNIELCTRELEGSECSCDGLIVFAANIVSHHSFFRWPNKEDPGELAGVEIIGNEKDGKGPTKRNTKHELESKSCKTCYKNATYLEHGSGKWKLGLQATEQEIQNCLENRRMKGDYGGAFNNCNVWTRDAAIECGLNCY
jgi:RHS repeat-associated protein